jgi:tetratricopeptide (TPR) repeat protein
MQRLKWLGLALCAGPLLLATGCAKLQSRDEMNKGVQAYRNNKYPDAVNHFKEAVQLDPANQNAQLYLATSYMIQWVPGADSPDNKKNYDAAQSEFQKVLQQDPKNSLALASMASMAYNAATAGSQEQKAAALEEARKWNQRRMEVDPKDAEPYYYLGVINYDLAYQPIVSARVAAHMSATDPGPIKEANAPKPKKGKSSEPTEGVRTELKTKYEKLIDDGIQDLKECLQRDKENEDAMSYINLLYRMKANLEDTPEQAKADTAQAEDWFNKAMDMRRVKASRAPKKTQAT